MVVHIHASNPAMRRFQARLNFKSNQLRRPTDILYRLIPVILLICLPCLHASSTTSAADETRPAADASGLDVRPANLTCVAPERPEGERPATVELEAVRVFPLLEFDRPIDLAQAPGDDSKWYLATRHGLVWRFDNDDDVETRSVSLDLLERLQFTGERQSQQWGITSFAFHPQFPDPPYLYVAYNVRPNRQSPTSSVVARFETADGGQTFAADSPTVILSLVQDIVIPDIEGFSRFHHLGQIAFGNYGYLYIGLGDPNGSTAQDLSNWHGSVLRVDVDGGEPYRIPPDNPFVGVANAKEEIYAYGFRNPWRFSFDWETGALWAGDVGWNSREEVDLVVSGGNYGWKIMEGNICVVDGCDAMGLIPPVVDYSHEVGRAVIGGFVYRGQGIPQLVGSYVFGDATSRDIWRLVDEDDGTPPRQPISRTSGSTPHVFAQDHAGELYFTSARSTLQGVKKLVPRMPENSGVAEFPALLSQTGCVAPEQPQAPADGVIPYRVNSPLWADGAALQRWMAIPDGAQIVAQPDGDMAFPIGTVLGQRLSIDDTPVETRLLIRHNDGGWAGHS